MTQHRVLRRVGFLEMGLTPGTYVLVDWLNENRGSSRYDRLVWLIENIRRAELLKKDLFAQYSEDLVLPRDSVKSVATLIRELNRALARYKVFPHFGPFSKGFWNL